MLNRRKLAIRAKINDYQGNLNKQWFVYFSCINPVTNKLNRIRVYEGINTYNSRSERLKVARKLMYRYNQKLISGRNYFTSEDTDTIYEDQLSYYKKYKKQVRSADYTISHFLNKYLVDHTQALRKKSHQTYTSKLRIFEKWIEKKNLQEIEVSYINRDLAKEFLNYIIQDKKLSATSRNAYLSTIKTFFKSLLDDDIIKTNPFDRIEKLPEQRQGKLPFKRQQQLQLKEFIQKYEPQLWLFIQFMFYCLIRPGELRLLKIGDLDIDEGQILIKGEISKNKKSQFVMIPDSFKKELELLKLYLFNQDYYVFSNNGQPGPEPKSRDYFNKIHKKITKDLGFSKSYTLYSWKSTGAISAVKSGASLKEVQLQLRHHSLDQVDIYLKSMGMLDMNNIKHNLAEL